VQSLSFTLPDGAAATIRPIEPSDRSALRAGFERLSPESRYRRFFTPMPKLSESDLDYLTQIDHHDHEALVAVADATGDIVGVTRFVRTGPDEAEPAIVVADDLQGKGLGTRLLTTLAERARQEGISTFRAPVLAENDAAIALLGSLGQHWTHHEGTEVEVEIDLTPAPEEPPVLIALLRSAAAGTVSPAVTLLDRLGLRARYGPPDRAHQENTIVVGVTPEASIGPAVGCAAELARVLGSSVQLVSAKRPLRDGDSDPEEALERAAREVREHGVAVDTHVRSSDAVTAIVQLAAERRARLVVIGAQAPDTPRLLPVDVPGAVARQAPCDVLIAR
jgi:nucleotide-binding universal stress UspA family protein/GNAT superfamily N-acetyltransferase